MSARSSSPISVLFGVALELLLFLAVLLFRGPAPSGEDPFGGAQGAVFVAVRRGWVFVFLFELRNPTIRAVPYASLLAAAPSQDPSRLLFPTTSLSSAGPAERPSSVRQVCPCWTERESLQFF
jgi:hypothetical protein